jgi:Bacteriocin-protection, YdeI or OmpD-Associated/Domain of unknown function (DUF1905)
MPGQSAPKSVTFRTTVRKTGNNTGIVVPPEVIAELGAGKRPAVLVDLKGFQYRNTVGVMAGTHLISVSAAVRAETGIEGGEAVDVTLTLTDSPRPVDVPPDLASALQANEAARAFFGTLSNSVQRFHIDQINGAKTAETRQRRIDKAIAMFLEGRKR